MCSFYKGLNSAWDLPREDGDWVGDHREQMEAYGGSMSELVRRGGLWALFMSLERDRILIVVVSS